MLFAFSLKEKYNKKSESYSVSCINWRLQQHSIPSLNSYD